MAERLRPGWLDAWRATQLSQRRAAWSSSSRNAVSWVVWAVCAASPGNVLLGAALLHGLFEELGLGGRRLEHRQTLPIWPSRATLRPQPAGAILRCVQSPSLGHAESADEQPAVWTCDRSLLKLRRQQSIWTVGRPV